MQNKINEHRRNNQEINTNPKIEVNTKYIEYQQHEYLKSEWISAVVRKPLPWRSRHRNKYVKPSGVSLFSKARTKSKKLSKSISRAFPPPLFPRRTCSSYTTGSTLKKKKDNDYHDVQDHNTLLNNSEMMLQSSSKKQYQKRIEPWLLLPIGNYQLFG